MLWCFSEIKKICGKLYHKYERKKIYELWIAHKETLLFMLLFFLLFIDPEEENFPDKSHTIFLLNPFFYADTLNH